jgi:putative redox protein
MAEHLEVTAHWRGGCATDVSARGHEVRVDEPFAAGGHDTGFMPTELFCAALASCFCLAVAFAAGKRGIEVPDLRVVVRTERADRELRYGRFVVDTRAVLDDATLATLVERARPLCWVSNTLAAGVALEYDRTSLEPRFRK